MSGSFARIDITVTGCQNPLVGTVVRVCFPERVDDLSIVALTELQDGPLDRGNETARGLLERHLAGWKVWGVMAVGSGKLAFVGSYWTFAAPQLYTFARFWLEWRNSALRERMR